MIRAIYEWVVDNDCTPYILVNAMMEGVEVPQQFVQDGQIVLNISPSAVVGLDVGNDELLATASESIARYKLPKLIVRRDVIVRSPAGKADYRWAREQVADEGS